MRSPLRAEWTASIMAILMIVLPLIPLLGGRTHPASRTITGPDPFPGSYVSESAVESAIEEAKKPSKLVLPEPTFRDWIAGGLTAPETEGTPAAPSPKPPKPAPAPVGVPVQAFLLEPKDQALLRRSTGDSGSYRVMFRFEVYPKDRNGTLEIRKSGKTLLEIPFETTPDGAHRAGALLPKPGVYEWRIVSGGTFKGDFRSFTLRP